MINATGLGVVTPCGWPSSARLIDMTTDSPAQASQPVQRTRGVVFSALLMGALMWANLGVSWAQEPPPAADAPLPPKVQDPDEQVQPQVVIRQEDDRVVHEYSADGQVYMIKVIPNVGPAYYLIDTTGQGNFESDQPHMEPVRPAYWRLFDWR